MELKLPRPLHWIRQDENGTLEFILDHHMLSTFRMCPARFYLEFVEGWKPRSTFWFLDFGALVHSCLEYYYIHFRKPDFKREHVYQLAAHKWHEGNFDQYQDHQAFKELQGLMGLNVLLLEYLETFSMENERIRVIGAELYFGKNREVPILDSMEDRIKFNFNCKIFLSGKIDLLVDNGFFIGPLDHKTHRDFRGRDPNKSYEIQEGMIGYAYASRKMLERLDFKAERKTNGIMMNHIQVKHPSVQDRKGKPVNIKDRFSRITMQYTDWALEQYRLRQISTVQAILQSLLNLERGIPFFFNAGVCSNWWHNECQFHQVHRLQDEQSQLLVLERTFNRGDIWDPEQRDVKKQDNQ